MLLRLVTLACLSTLNIQLSTALAQGTAFTYQGRLNDGAAPATGIYDIRFTIYDSTNSPGVVISGPVTNNATPVSNGLFTVILDFGNQFGGAARWLEIAVRTNGVGTFTNLAPRQPLTATPYAITAGNVTGPINGSSIISGTIGSAQLAAGAVTAANIASNSIGVGQLSHRYLSGSVPYASLVNGQYGFSPFTADQSVTFATPFTTTPVITLAVDTPHPALPGKGPLLITAHTTNGFTMRVPTMAVGVEAAPQGNSGARPTLRTVNGNPAITGVAQIGLTIGLVYSRSADATGANWPTPTILAPGYLLSSSLDMAGDSPAVTFIDALGGISFVRANDTNGTSWPAPTQIAAPAAVGGGGLRLSGLLVNGNPAWLAANFTTNVYYLRANDNPGSSWGAPSRVFSTSNSVNSISLALVGGRPAIAVCGDNRIFFARANDTNGTSWPTFTTAVFPNNTNDIPSGNLSLMDIAGKPALGYVGQAGASSVNYFMFFVQSTDTNGASWDLPKAFTTSSPSFPTPVFNVVGGAPYVVFTQNGILHLIESFPLGGSFQFPSPFDIEPGDGNCTIETVGGQPAIVFYGNNSLRCIRQGTPPPNSAINWIAVEP